MIDTVNFRILWEEFLLRYEKYCLGMRKGIVIYYSSFLIRLRLISIDSAAITCDAVTINRMKFEW